MKYADTVRLVRATFDDQGLIDNVDSEDDRHARMLVAVSANP